MSDNTDRSEQMGEAVAWMYSCESYQSSFVVTDYMDARAQWARSMPRWIETPLYTRTPSSPPAQAAPVSGEVTPWDVAQAERHYPPDCWRREAITDLAQFVSEVRRAALATPPASASQVEVVAEIMTFEAGLLWSTLPEMSDAACGQGMPEGCRSYWRRIAQAVFNNMPAIAALQAERPTPILEK